MPADHDSLYALIAETADQRLADQLRFVLEIDRLKGIVRQTPLIDGSRTRPTPSTPGTSPPWRSAPNDSAMAASWDGWPGHRDGKVEPVSPYEHADCQSYIREEPGNQYDANIDEEADLSPLANPLTNSGSTPALTSGLGFTIDRCSTFQPMLCSVLLRE